jgi:hypothetical protein
MTATQAVAFGAVADNDRENRLPKTIRIEPTLWEALGPAAATNGLDRSGLLRQFARWYLNEPGAQLPQRPERVED